MVHALLSIAREEGVRALYGGYVHLINHKHYMNMHRVCTCINACNLLVPVNVYMYVTVHGHCVALLVFTVCRMYVCETLDL